MTSPPTEPASTTAPAPRPRRRRRWLWRLLLVAVVARLLLAMFLPQLIQLAAGTAALRATMGDASLSLFGLSLHVTDLELTADDHPEAPPLLRAHDLIADLSLRELLRGRLCVVDAVCSGAVITVQRAADGSLSLPAAWTRFATPAEVAAEPAPAPISFALPVRIESARLHDVTVRWLDQSTQPARDESCTIDLDATQLGHDDRPGHAQLRLHSPRWIDDLWLELDLLLTAECMQLQWRGAVRGVRPHELPTPLPADLLALLLDLHALGADLRGQCTATVRKATPRHPEITGELEFELHGDGDRLAALQSKVGPSTVGDGAVQIPFQLAMQAPDAVQELAVTDGSLQLGASTTVLGTLRGRGLSLTRLQPLLSAHGVTLPANGLDLGLGFETEFGSALSLQLRDLSLGSGDERASLDRLVVRDLRTAADGIAIDHVELDRPRARLRRTGDRGTVLAGIGVRAAPVTPPPATTAAVAEAPLRLPQLRLGTLVLNDGGLTFVDETLTAPAELSLTAVSLRGSTLSLGHDAPPGQLSLQAQLAGVLGALQCDATLQPSAGALRTELQLQLDAITLAGLDPWLQAAGLTAEPAASSLSLVAGCTATEIEHGLALDLQLANLRWRRGDERLLGVRAVTGTGVQLLTDRIELGSWRVDEPFLDLAATASGGWRLLGLELGNASPAAPAAAAPVAPSPAAPSPAAAAEPVASALHHGELALHGAVVQLRAPDQPPLRLGVDAALAAHAGGSAPQPFTAALRLDGAIDRATVRGQVQQQPLAVDLELELSGLRGAGLQRFLPPRVGCSLVDGDAHLSLQLRRDAAPATGLSLQLDAVQLRDRQQELVGFDRMRLELAELGADALHVKELLGTGLRGRVTLADEGLHVPGFVLLAAAPATAATTAAPTAAPTTDASLPRAPVRIPLLRIDRIDVDTTRLELRDRRGGEGEPLLLTGRLTLADWAPKLDGDEPAPARLQLVGTALPLCRELRSELALHLYDLAPSIELQLAATGIDFTAVPRLSPRLSALTGTTAAASLRAKLHGRLDLKRRDPRQFDPGRPFAGELLLEDVELRDDTADRVLASLTSIDVIARAIDPRTGDTLLRAIDIDSPRCTIDRTADGGFELFGLRLPAPASAKPAAAEPAATEPTAATNQPPVAVAAGPRPEFAVDRLTVQGGGLVFTDHTTAPPTPLPLTDFDLELSRFSTRAFTEPRRIGIRASLRGDPVPLERRIVRSSLLAGVVASTAAAIGGGADVHTMEPRPAVAEMSLRGDLQLAPFASGEITADIQSLELPLLRGFAKQGGVDLADGLLDHRATVRLRGADGVTVDSSTVFTWLSVTEPPGGPISTYLRLPAPLDSVLFLLRNDADEHRIPVHLEIPSSGMSSGTVVQAAAEAVIKVLADAVASAAARTTGMLTGAVGLTGGAASTASAPRQFAGGDPLPEGGDLAPVIAALADDDTLQVVLQHEVGAGDLARASALATPDLPLLTARVEQLRRQRREWTAQREPMAAELQALYAAARMPAARVLQARLLAHDERLGELEQTLDQALAMLAADNPRARHRRTQAALQALAKSRLDAVIHELRTELPDLAPRRIVLRPGRAVAIAGLDGGGRVIATVRRATIE